MQRESNIAVHTEGDSAIIEVSGDLTADAEQAMDTAYKEASAGNPQKILLKFDRRSRINSAGISIIIEMVIESRKQGIETSVTGLSKHFQKIFELVGLTQYTKIVESEAEIKSE
jgi:anti-anti-sigma factor